MKKKQIIEADPIAIRVSTKPATTRLKHDTTYITVFADHSPVSMLFGAPSFSSTSGRVNEEVSFNGVVKEIPACTSGTLSLPIEDELFLIHNKKDFLSIYTKFHKHFPLIVNKKKSLIVKEITTRAPTGETCVWNRVSLTGGKKMLLMSIDSVDTRNIDVATQKKVASGMYYEPCPIVKTFVEAQSCRLSLDD